MPHWAISGATCPTALISKVAGDHPVEILSILDGKVKASTSAPLHGASRPAGE